jgi:hypothetical protein
LTQQDGCNGWRQAYVFAAASPFRLGLASVVYGLC